jgi:hypothetical protein
VTYPAPKLIRSDPVVGAKLIQPVALEGYDKGYNATVEDHYEPAYWVEASQEPRTVWRWVRRVRTWTRPLHYNHEGHTIHCEECARWYEQYPTRPDEVLAEAENLAADAPTE